MVLTRKQEEGLKIAVSRFKDCEPWTCISGYAGTGKSTLVKFIIAALNLNPDEVCYVAFTGKAANVLKQKGCANATTAHKLLYRSRILPNGKYIHEPRKTLDPFIKLIIVDEVSMLPKHIWDLLIGHRIHVIALGDPEQLPPVDEDNGILANPHIFLDEIMRQAQESEIIRLSMHVREGRPLATFEQAQTEVQIITPAQVVSGMYEWADQIICATNANRNKINMAMRKLKNFPDTPVQEDKIISLKNHWECFSNQGSALTNGSIGHIVDSSVQRLEVPRYIIPQGYLDVLYTDLLTEDNETFTGLFLDYQQLLTGEKTLQGKQEYQMLRSKMTMDPPFDFAYGYAITCWKAQGSEWDKVLLFEENFPFSKEEHKRYLYTGITRAKNKIVIVRK